MYIHAEACDVDVLYSDVLMSHKSYVYKCVQLIKLDFRRNSVFASASS